MKIKKFNKLRKFKLLKVFADILGDLFEIVFIGVLAVAAFLIFGIGLISIKTILIIAAIAGAIYVASEIFD